jgi:hypothetical protein
MSRKLTISSIEHMVRLLSQKPELLSLSSLSPLKAVAEKAREEAKSCGCNAGKVYRANEGVFNVALGNIQNGDHMIMKRLLGVDQICYYIKSEGSTYKLKCI